MSGYSPIRTLIPGAVSSSGLWPKRYFAFQLWSTVIFETTLRGEFKPAEPDFGMENNRYKTYQVQLGKRIQKLRNEAGVTQEELANKVERSSEQISNIERGKSWPSFELIFEIAEALNVSPAKFFDWAVPPKRTEVQATRDRMITRFSVLLERAEPVSAEEVIEIAQALVKKGG
jgi:transcriptional regulator with XRE-family HTH domain